MPPAALVPEMYRAPAVPWPFLMVSPSIVTFELAVMASAEPCVPISTMITVLALPPSRVMCGAWSPARSPSMVTLLVMVSAEDRLMVWPLSPAAKVMVSPSWAFASASRSEPAPESLVLVTVVVCSSWV